MWDIPTEVVTWSTETKEERDAFEARFAAEQERYKRLVLDTIGVSLAQIDAINPASIKRHSAMRGREPRE